MGAEVTVHKCMGKTAITVFGVDFNKHCKCTHKSHPTKCCNSHTVTLKAGSEPYTAPFKVVSFQPNVFDKIVHHLQRVIAPRLVHLPVCSRTDVPPQRGLSLGTLFCVFRI